jgi:putative tricarboxylic transport membrane protein
LPAAEALILGRLWRRSGSGTLAASKTTRLRAPTDFVAGLFFLGLAALGFWLLRDVRLGTSMRMGPGYLPTVLCWILAFVGLAMVGRSFLIAGPPLERWYPRPLLFVVGSLLLFSFSIDKLGLAATIVAMVVVAAFATPESRWKEVVIAAVALAAFSAGLFVKALGLPLAIWPQVF